MMTSFLNNCLSIPIIDSLEDCKFSGKLYETFITWDWNAKRTKGKPTRRAKEEKQKGNLKKKLIYKKQTKFLFIYIIRYTST